MSVFCITQARLGSTRLPRKVLMPINGIAMLEYHAERVKHASKVDHHILATTQSSEDDELVAFCKAKQYAVFRGSEFNVLERFYNAALDAGAKPDDTLVRLTGDCPLSCPVLIDKVIETHQAHNVKGYTHLSLAFWARGFDIEVFSMQALTDTFNKASLPNELEHVTYYMYTHPNEFTILPVEQGNARWKDYRLCVDEPDDMAFMQALMPKLGDNWRDVSAAQICALIDQQPSLLALNKAVVQRYPH